MSKYKADRNVVLMGRILLAHTCDCGADYNWSGMRLAPRECWGEETGETAAEILMAEAGGFPEEVA